MPEEPASTHGSFFKRKRTASNINKSISSTSITASSTASRPTTSHRRDSSLSSLNELREGLRKRSSSLRSHRARSPGPVNLAYLQSSDKRSASTTNVPSLTVSIVPPRQKSAESVPRVQEDRSPISAPEFRSHRTGLPLPQGPRKDDANRPITTPKSAPGDINVASLPIVGHNNSSIIFNQIHEVAGKRISTLDYLRKTHEGRVYWFNALFFTRNDLLKIPYFEAQKLGRRAANYLCLGLSIPAILDPNLNNLSDYLRAFNSLLSEFESYQAIHSPDATSSSFSRNKLPQMFKRATHSNNQKTRRGSSADAISPQMHDTDSTRSVSATQSAYNSFSGGHQELLPGEEYTFLLTPSLPFDPDYFETFATLCDVLIDCYTNIVALLTSPEACSPGIGDQFAKADARVRKILVAGVAKDFEEASKQGIRNEMTGIKKIVLGGLM